MLIKLLLGSAIALSAQVGVLTQHNDAGRTGANLNETILNTKNVNVSQFGKLFSRAVDGQIYAQPLYAPAVNIAGSGVQNVVYVATMHNSVYAFNADDSAAAKPLWQINAGPSAPAPCPDDTNPEIGITSTPVIDPSSATLYFAAKTQEADGAILYRLHAVDITNGRQKPGSPVVIQAAVAGNGLGVVNGRIAFDASIHLNRPALLLSGGIVYLAFGAHCDAGNFHGWIMGYNAATLQQTAVYNVTSHGGFGGIWNSGQGPAVDSLGNLYVITSNGSFDGNQSGGYDFSDSFLKLSPSLSILDWFTPFNNRTLQINDLDLGGGGAVLVPGTSLVIGGGKQGVLYVLDTNNMGHYNASGDAQIVQSFQAVSGRIAGSPVFWNAPNGQFIYLWGSKDHLRQYRFADGLIQTTPFATTGATIPNGGSPGGILAISANGSARGTGILWANRAMGSAQGDPVPGILHAFDASNVATELWNSAQNAARDDFGTFAKFCPPTIANGKVYLATFSNQLVVYGLLSSPAPAVTGTSPASGATGVAVTTVVTATFSSAVDATTIDTTAFTLVEQSTGKAVAATVSYNPATRTATLTPVASLANNTTYTATVAGVTWSFTTAAPPGGPAIPTEGLGLWLEADAGIRLNGGAVSEWVDQSGSGNNATQTSAANRPTLAASAVNGKPAVSFNGTSSAMDFNLPVNGLTGMTIFLVNANAADYTGGAYRTYNAPLFWDETPSSSVGAVHVSPFESAVNWRFGTGQPGNRPVYTRPAPIGTEFTMTSLVKDGVAENLYVGGQPAMTQTGKLPAIANTEPTGHLGSGYLSTFWSGRIAEVIVYTRALAGSERGQVENYLTAKYFRSSPAPAATGVAVTTPVTATFSAAIDAAAIGAGTFMLVEQSTGTPVAAAVAYDPAIRTATLTPAASLANNTTYTAMVGTGGNNVTRSFTTAVAAAPQPPPADRLAASNNSVRSRSQ